MVMKTRRRSQEVSPTEADQPKSVQPYCSSYFLPGKIAGKAATFLLYYQPAESAPL